MFRNVFALLLAMWVTALMSGIAQAEPKVVLDRDFSKADQKADFAGRGRLSIPVESASDTPQYFRLTIESRDATRTPVYLSFRGATSPVKTYWSGTLDPNET